ncbi:MAG: hypothetical protein KDI71_01780 [Xanthomonadales bacterium]|nr:hypothetical protein [Xanthomonadales bacterium]
MIERHAVADDGVVERRSARKVRRSEAAVIGETRQLWTGVQQIAGLRGQRAALAVANQIAAGRLQAIAVGCEASRTVVGDDGVAGKDQAKAAMHIQDSADDGKRRRRGPVPGNRAMAQIDDCAAVVEDSDVSAIVTDSAVLQDHQIAVVADQCTGGLGRVVCNQRPLQMDRGSLVSVDATHLGGAIAANLAVE